MNRSTCFVRPINPLSFFLLSAASQLIIGEKGTGTNVLALTPLAPNSIKPGGPTALLEIDDEEAEKALLAGKIDGASMMGDSASSGTMRDLLKHPEITAFNFSQADAYTRRIRYLSKLILLEGSIDFGKNVPDHNINLLSPTVELIARENLHPALSDLLLEAATEVHSRAGRYQRQGQSGPCLSMNTASAPMRSAFTNQARAFYTDICRSG